MTIVPVTLRRHLWHTYAVVAVAACLCSPGEVLASCGDYLHHGTGHVALTIAGPMSLPAAAPPAVPCPCRGLSCHRSETPQAPLVPLVWQSLPDLWACLSGGPLLLPPQEMASRGADQCPRGDGHPLDLERPPR